MKTMIGAINWELVRESGVVITLVGILIVFAALFLLFLVFYYLPVFMNFLTRVRLKKQGKEYQLARHELHVQDEVTAAIGTAIYLHLVRMHDEEDTVITIKRISKNYSPWSSKIYGIIRGLNRKF